MQKSVASTINPRVSLNKEINKLYRENHKTTKKKIL